MKTEIIEFKNFEIYCPIHEGQIYVAIRPICEALGIDHSGQIQRVKRDKKTLQLWVLVPTVGADNKAREMMCLPLKYIFGWLFTIDTDAVKEEVRDGLVAYQLECYEVLYDHFWANGKNLLRKDEMLSQSERKILELELSKSKLTQQIKAEKERFKEIALAPVNQLYMFGDDEISVSLSPYE